MRDDPSKKPGLNELLDPRLRPVQMTLKDAEAELRKQIGDLDLRSAETDITNGIYSATELLERLEGAQLVLGNGHHMRQQLTQKMTELLQEAEDKITEAAVALLRERWQGPKTEN